MNKILIGGLFFLGCYVINSETTKAQEKSIARGRIVDLKNGKPVSYAKVINKNRRRAVVSDTTGAFAIVAYPSDTLYISTIGYSPLLVEVKDSFIWHIRPVTISLKPRVYELATLDIKALPTYQEFKNKILQDAFYHRDTIEDNLAYSFPEAERPYNPQPTMSLGSPVSALYKLMSKEGKGIRAYERARSRNRMEAIISPKYNRGMVSRITGLTGEVLDDFMLYCKPEETFLANASEYDICRRIYSCFDTFILLENR
jgi:hypothetical protein